jgi:hypothetical protein
MSRLQIGTKDIWGKMSFIEITTVVSDYVFVFYFIPRVWIDLFAISLLFIISQELHFMYVLIILAWNNLLKYLIWHTSSDQN